MIRGGGRSKKALDAKDESEDEENSPDADIIPEEDKRLTPTTPPALPSSVPCLHADPASMVPQARIDECRYVEGPPTLHFRPVEGKDNYQDHQAEYSMPVEVNSSLGDLPHHRSSGHVFEGEAFVEHSYGNMPEIRSHADIFSSDAQQLMLGQWHTSDLYPIHYSGEPSQPPTMNPPDGNQIFGHYPYGNPSKQPFRSEGYSAEVYGRFPSRWDDRFSRPQRANTSYYARPSTPSFPSANTVMHHQSHELPSHIRA
jgi:hypothetical protein